MAQAKLEKTNQITRIIDKIPPYSGSVSGLYSFTQHIDEIIEIAKPVNDVYPNIITRSIRNKIIDKANEALELYNTPNNKRDESVLIQDLHNLHQGNDSVEIFFAKISEILNNLKNWAKINESLAAAQKNQWYDKMGLNIFCCKLREPMGSHVRSMQPIDLPTARSICMREQSLAGLRYSHKPAIHQKPNVPPRNFMLSRPQSFNPPIYSYPKPTFNNNNYNSFNKKRDQYYNHNPFPPKHNFGQPKPIMPKVEPMDTTSNLNKYSQPTLGQQFHKQQQNTVPPYKPTNYPGTYRFQQNGPARFQTREVFNVEESEEYNYQPEEEYEPLQEELPIVEIEDEDFHQTSSEIPDS